ncbi:MAG: hypothetical protein AB7O37_13780 [Vicinamibacteria bacterium]
MLVTAWLAVLLLLDSVGLFLTFTYVPVLAATAALTVALWLLGRSGFLDRRSVSLGIVVLWCGACLLPLVPTTCGKRFYVASWAVWPGTSAAFADRMLAGFDDAPPYRPSEGAVSYRCVCDPSTTDYVMLTIVDGYVTHALYLPD